MFARGSGRQKFAVGATVFLAVVLISLLPAATWTRLVSFSKNPQASDEALASSESRQYLLRRSIIYIFQNPFFGVGPRQFASYEGQSMNKQGLQGSWHDTHNSYTQISSECRIPALGFYLAAVISTFGLLARIRKRATGLNAKETVTSAYCITIGLVAYCTAALFVNFGYQFELPAISGLVVAMWFTVCNDRRRLANGTLRAQSLPDSP